MIYLHVFIRRFAIAMLFVLTVNVCSYGQDRNALNTSSNTSSEKKYETVSRDGKIEIDSVALINSYREARQKQRAAEEAAFLNLSSSNKNNSNEK